MKKSSYNLDLPKTRTPTSRWCLLLGMGPENLEGETPSGCSLPISFFGPFRWGRVREQERVL